MWQSVFDLQLSVGDKDLRAVLTYLFLVVALRIVGKRELGGDQHASGSAAAAPERANAMTPPERGHGSTELRWRGGVERYSRPRTRGRPAWR